MACCADAARSNRSFANAHAMWLSHSTGIPHPALRLPPPHPHFRTRTHTDMIRPSKTFIIRRFVSVRSILRRILSTLLEWYVLVLHNGHCSRLQMKNEMNFSFLPLPTYPSTGRIFSSIPQRIGWRARICPGIFHYLPRDVRTHRTHQ